MGAKRKILHILPSLVFSLILITAAIQAISGWASLPAFAAFTDYTKYTTALEDLSGDENFNAGKYIDDAGDYSLQVIQIAESSDGELFVYVYQPCQKTRYLVATSLNMSLAENADGTKLYSLTLLNVSGVLCKYTVKGLKPQLGNPHFYNITSIYRAWDKDIDKDTGNDNTINEVVYDVGQLWTVTTKSDGVHYSCDGTERITVTNKYCGHMRFYDGYKLYKTACDSHYIAFSTDHYIQTLLEADVAFVTKDYTCNITSIQQPPEMGGGATNFYDYTYSDPVPRQVRVTADQQGGNTGDGLWGEKYLWDRIEKVSDFLKDEQNDFTDEAKAALKDKQWVLRFIDIPYVLTPHLGGSTEKGTKVTDETILRLEFETDGERYNLGVVDNKQTGGDKPSNKPNVPNLWSWLAAVTGIPAWFWKLLTVIIPLAILLPVLSIIFPPFGEILKKIFNGIWTIITRPFVWLGKGIKALHEKAKANKAAREQAAAAEASTAATPTAKTKKKTAKKKATKKERAKGNEKRKPRNGKKKKNPPRGNR